MSQTHSENTMEIENSVPQICRLCGQLGKIFIEVFGEEGIRRLLAEKISSQIHVSIDERDPLPKAICVQCLGKLEFVCDFQEECLRTQQLLRERYNLSPLTNVDEIKHEETLPSTSSNNNCIEKNLNSPASTNGSKEVTVLSTPKTISKPQRTRRNISIKNNDENVKENTSPSESEGQNINEINGQTSKPTRTRWLRSRQNNETPVVNNTERPASIANRLRSHVSGSSEINAQTRNSVINTAADDDSNESNEMELGEKEEEPTTVQIPTSALNKLLSIVSHSPDVDVAVKESKNRNCDAEDISFTVELAKKENESIKTARATVFPDRDSCMVDTTIVKLLEDQGNTEINAIISTIISSATKSSSPTKLKDLAELEKKLEASQNPEELYRMDGEEIRVDNNVEQVVVDKQSGYACKLCRKFYERKDKCTVHVKTHLGIKQFTCVLCNAKFVCKSDVMKHIRCSHTNPRPIQCPKCPKRFKSKFYLAEHDNVHKGVRPYRCSDCGQSYHHKVSLQIHMKSHLPPQNLACEYCGKVFPYRTRLLSHIASVHLKNRRNFRCRFCYNLYSSLAVLNEHIKTRHATTYTCETCSKTFKVASKYKAHVLQHSNPKPFVCNVCNNRYASKAFLNEHLLKHEGLRKHICQKCGASFAQASHLAAHRHVHGEKTHACPECGRKFNRRDNMKVHRKRHFEDKKSGAKQKIAAAEDGTPVDSNEK